MDERQSIRRHPTVTAETDFGTAMRGLLDAIDAAATAEQASTAAKAHLVQQMRQAAAAGVSISQIAHLTGQARSTVYRAIA